MARTFKLKRGLKKDLPVLAEGEPAFTLDEKKLYIGTGQENVVVGSQTELDEHIKDTDLHVTAAKQSTWNNAATTASEAKTAAETAQATAEAAQTVANGKATATVHSATLSTAWAGSEPYTQAVSVSGITAAMSPVVDVILDSDTVTAKNQLEAWACVDRIVTGAGTITAYCYEDKPEAAIPIQIKVVE